MARDMSKGAVQYGMSLAKAVNAKVTGVTVSPPFHVLAAVTDTCKSYKDEWRTSQQSTSNK